MRHRSAAALAAALDHLRAAPAETGTVELIVARPAVGERRLLESAELHPEVGLVGDGWRSRRSRSTADGRPDPDKQLTVMNHRMVALLGDTAEEQALAGDQLYVDLDLSVENLPVGTRLALGSAVIEVTAAPHLGCKKFVARYGADAMRFVNGPEGRPLRLRGLNARVVAAGTVCVGEKVLKEPDLFSDVIGVGRRSGRSL